MGVTPRQLTEAADLMVRGVEAWLWSAYAVLLLAGLGLLFAGSRAPVPAESRARRAGAWLLGLVWVELLKLHYAGRPAVVPASASAEFLVGGREIGPADVAIWMEDER